MTDAEQIADLIQEYAQAAKQSDLPKLKALCTPAMFRQFNLPFRLMMAIARLFMRKRLRDLKPENIEIEKQEEQRAIVSYSASFGMRRRYERVVVVKEDGAWKVDGKYA